MSTCPFHEDAVDDPCEFCTSDALAAHAVSYVDSEGEERCSTCDKWLEPGYYTIEDHQQSIAQVIGNE